MALAFSFPVALNGALKVRMGEGKFFSLNTTGSGNADWVVVSLPQKGTLFQARNSSGLLSRLHSIEAIGTQSPEGLFFYLPFHSVRSGNPIDTIQFRAHPSTGLASLTISMDYVPPLPIGGGAGWALKFDGGNDIVTNNVEGWFPSQEFTIMIWMQSDASRRSGQAILSYSNFGGAAIEVLNTSNVQVSIGDVLLPATSMDINDGQWHHIAVTYSKASGKCKLFIDGRVSMDVQIPPTAPEIPRSGLLVLGNRPGCDLLSKEERDQISTHAILDSNKSSILFPANGNHALYRKPSTMLRQLVTDRQHALGAPSIRNSHFGSPWNVYMAYDVEAAQSFLLDSTAGGCFDRRLSFAGLLDDLRSLEPLIPQFFSFSAMTLTTLARIYSFAKVADEISVEKDFNFFKIVNQADVPDRFRSQSSQFYHGLQLLHSFDPMSDLTSSLPSVMDDSGNGRKSYCGGVKTSTLSSPVYAKRAPTSTCSTAPISGGLFYCLTHGYGDASKIFFDVFLPGNFGPGSFTGTLYFRVDSLPKISAKNKLFNYNSPKIRNQEPMVARASVSLGNKVGVTVSNGIPTLFPSADFFVYRLYDVGIFLDPTSMDDPSYPVLNYTVLLEPARLVVPIDMKVNIRTDLPAIIYPLAFAPDLTNPRVILFENNLESSMAVQHLMELPCADIPDCSDWIIGSQFSQFEAASGASQLGQRTVLSYTVSKSPSIATQATKRFCLTNEFSVGSPSLLPELHCKAAPIAMTDPLMVASVPSVRMFFSPFLWHLLETSTHTVPFPMGQTSSTPFTCLTTSGGNIANSECVCRTFDSSDPCNLCTCSSEPNPRQQTEIQVVLQQCTVYAHLRPIPTPVCVITKSCSIFSNFNPTITRQAPLYLTRGSFMNVVLDESSDPLQVVRDFLDDPKVSRSIIGPESMMLAMLRPTFSEEMVKLLIVKNVPFDEAVLSYAARIDRMSGSQFFSSLNSNKNASGYNKTTSKGVGDTCLVRGQVVKPGRQVLFDLPWRFAVSPLRTNFSEFSGSIRLDWFNPTILASANSEKIRRRQEVIVRARRLIETVTLSQSSHSLVTANDSPVALTLSSIQITSSCKHWKVVNFPSHGTLFSLDDFSGPDICFRSGLRGTQHIAAMFCKAFGFGVLPSDLTSSSQSFLNQLPWNVSGTSTPYSSQASILMGNRIRSTEQFVSQAASFILNSSTNSSGISSLDSYGASRDLSPVPTHWGRLWSSGLNYGRVLVDSSYTLGDNNLSFYSKCGLSGVEGLVLEFAHVVQPKSLVLKAAIKSHVRMRVLAKTMPKRQHHRHVLHDDQPTARISHTRNSYVVDHIDNSTVSELRQLIKPKTLLTSAWSYVDSETNHGWVELWTGNAGDASAVDGQNLGELKIHFCLSDVTAWFETRTLIVEVCGSIGQSFEYNLDSSPLEGVLVATLDGFKGGTSSGRVVSPTANVIYMPNKQHSGKDAFEYVGIRTTSEQRSSSAHVNVTVAPSPIQIAAESIDIIAPQGSTITITLSGFSFNPEVAERATAFITVLPSLVRLFQHDGLPFVMPQNASSTSGASSLFTGVKVTDLIRRIKAEIFADAGGIPYDFLEYKLLDPASNTASDAQVVQFNIWCRPGFYMSSNASDLRCLPCGLGQFTPKLHSNKFCELCPAGSSSVSASSSCSPCQPGTYAPVMGSKKCMPCEPGYVAAQTSMKTCDSCPMGSFNPLFGQTQCRHCGNYGYSTQNAATSCFDCPLLTRSGSPQSGSVEFCECEAGAYRSDLSPGKECKPCPTGAFCHGRTMPPVTRTGFWTSSSDWPEESVAQYWMCDHKGVRNVCLGFPDIRQLEDILKCSYRSVDGVCNEIGLPIDVNISNQDKRRCANGYSGRLCSVCTNGNYKSSSGSCEECPSIGVVIMGIAVVIAVFVLIIFAVSSSITTLYIIICWLQLLSCFSNLSISWPPALARLWGYLTIFNFNFRVAPSSCLFSADSNWKDAWFFEVLILSIVVSANAFRWALPYYSSKTKLNLSAVRSLPQKPVSHVTAVTPGFHRPSRPSSSASSGSREEGSKFRFKDKIHPEISANIDGEMAVGALQYHHLKFLQPSPAIIICDFMTLVVPATLYPF
jgi:hypothetical protein